MFNRKLNRWYIEAFVWYLIAFIAVIIGVLSTYAFNETTRISRLDILLVFGLFSAPMILFTEVDNEAEANQHKRYMERKQAELEFVKAKALPTASSIELKIDKLNGLFTGEIEKR